MGYIFSKIYQRSQKVERALQLENNELKLAVKNVKQNIDQFKQTFSQNSIKILQVSQHIKNLKDVNTQQYIKLGQESELIKSNFIDIKQAYKDLSFKAERFDSRIKDVQNKIESLSTNNKNIIDSLENKIKEIKLEVQYTLEKPTLIPQKAANELKQFAPISHLKTLEKKIEIYKGQIQQLKKLNAQIETLNRNQKYLFYLVVVLGAGFIVFICYKYRKSWLKFFNFKKELARRDLNQSGSQTQAQQPDPDALF